MRDLAATLTVLAAGPNCVGGAQVGDGGVVLREESGELSTLLAPQAGEYINETTFLVSPDYLDSIQTACRPSAPQELTEVRHD